MEPFNLEQFKQGRKAITRDGRVASFLHYAHELRIDSVLGVRIDHACISYCESGVYEEGREDELDLLHMAPAEHGIESMPWDLPAPPAPPEGHQWVYRGLGWVGVKKVRYACLPSGVGVWTDSHTEKHPLGGRDWHYLEAVPIAQPVKDSVEAVDPYAELKAAHAAGKVIQVRYDEGWEADRFPNWCLAATEYRIKPAEGFSEEFPPAPEGHAYHNPENLTPEQVGVSEGWRLLLEDEQAVEGDEVNLPLGWEPTLNYGGHTKSASLTYRTKRPLPTTPPKLMPLEAEDISPGSVLRKNHAGVCGWIAITYVSPEFVIARELHINYETLYDDGWWIKRPGEDWMLCRKEAK